MTEAIFFKYNMMNPRYISMECILAAAAEPALFHLHGGGQIGGSVGDWVPAATLYASVWRARCNQAGPSCIM